MKKLTTPKGKSYWAENGAYSELISQKYNELVPASGEADTIHGELVRCISRLVYEYCNNGNCNAIDTHRETCEECDGSGYEEQDCHYCENGEVWDDDEEDYVPCDECDGEGHEMVDCSYCGGDCEIDGDRFITEYYDKMLDFLEDNLLDINCVHELRQFMLRTDIGYSSYTFDDSEMKFYNAVADEVGYQVSTTENQKRDI